MLIDSISIENFRSIKDETLDCEDYTVLVGHNGAGKSSFLQALRLFMKPGAKPSEQDYYDGNTSEEIRITVEFRDLTDAEQENYQSNLNAESRLVVQRTFPGGEYAGLAYGCPGFEPLRELARKGKPVRKVQVPTLQEMVESGEFPGLQVVRQNIGDELNRWEEEHPDRCERYLRKGMFDGPPNIAGGGLARRTHFVYVPAVQKASEEAEDTRRSQYFSDLLQPVIDLVTQTEEVSSQFETAQGEYDNYCQLIKESPKKERFEQQMTGILQRYVPDTQANLHLEPDEMEEPDVKGQVCLWEGGFSAPVSRAGHGLQRTYILSIVELYQRLQVEEENETADIVFAIEEPELYQHPTRLRSIHRTFQDLTLRDGDSSIRFQAICTTHNPALIDFEAFDSVRRVFRKPARDSEAPKISQISAADLTSVGKRFLECKREEDVGPNSRHAAAKLRNIMTASLNEGFFANVVILVEGLEDAGAVSGVAENAGIDLDARGVSVIAAGGKNNLLYPACVFESLGIPVFLIFDMDAEKPERNRNADTNRALLRFGGMDSDSSPSTERNGNVLRWNETLGKHLQDSLGEETWQDAFEEACNYYNLSSQEGRKKYCVKRRAVYRSLNRGGELSLLEEFVQSAAQCASQANLS